MPSNPTSSDSSKPVLGIDVSGKRLDLAYSDGQVPTPVDYDPDGLRKLIQLLADKPASLVVCESTGGIEQTLLDTLLDAGIAVARVHRGARRGHSQAHR